MAEQEAVLGVEEGVGAAAREVAAKAAAGARGEQWAEDTTVQGRWVEDATVGVAMEGMARVVVATVAAVVRETPAKGGMAAAQTAAGMGVEQRVAAAVVCLPAAVVVEMVIDEEAKATVEVGAAAEEEVTAPEAVAMEREEMGEPMVAATSAVVGVEARVGAEAVVTGERAGSQDPNQASPSRSRSCAPKPLHSTAHPQAR